MRKELAKDAERSRRDVLVSLLEVVDNLDRAIDAAKKAPRPGSGQAGTDAGDPLLQGVEMVQQQFLAKMDGFGVKRIDALGAEFDPLLHEAVTAVPAPDDVIGRPRHGRHHPRLSHRRRDPPPGAGCGRQGRAADRPLIADRAPSANPVRHVRIARRSAPGHRARPRAPRAAAITSRSSRPNIIATRIAATGLGFHPAVPDLRPDDKALIRATMDERRGPEEVFRFMLAHLPRTYADYARAVEADEPDLLIASELAYAGPILAEKIGLRWASMTLSPLSFLSPYDETILPPVPWLSRLHALGPGAYGAILSLVKRIAGRMARADQRLQARPRAAGGRQSPVRREALAGARPGDVLAADRRAAARLAGQHRRHRLCLLRWR